MKISALKKMIKECVREVIREEMILLERSQPSAPVVNDVPRSSDTGINEIRQRFRKSQKSSSGYDDLSGAPRSSSDTPRNPKKILKDGQVFASGQGIMEWFKSEKGEEALDNHEEAVRKMQRTDQYVQGLIGKKLV